MAALEVRRYDGKLDSFLFKKLPQEDYERISTSEPCVVLSAEDKRVHRHVILGHRCIYLTEFPPKNLKVAVNLRDVTAIKIVSCAAACRVLYMYVREGLPCCMHRFTYH